MAVGRVSLAWITGDGLMQECAIAHFDEELKKPEGLQTRSGA